MRIILLIVAFTIVIWIVYNSILTFYAFKLERKLRKQKLEKFIEMLGSGHKYRDLGNGSIRRKWKKGWITIKADFDEALISYNETFNFWFHNIAKWRKEHG